MLLEGAQWHEGGCPAHNRRTAGRRQGGRGSRYMDRRRRYRRGEFSIRVEVLSSCAVAVQQKFHSLVLVFHVTEMTKVEVEARLIVGKMILLVEDDDCCCTSTLDFLLLQSFGCLAEEENASGLARISVICSILHCIVSTTKIRLHLQNLT